MTWPVWCPVPAGHLLDLDAVDVRRLPKDLGKLCGCGCWCWGKSQPPDHCHRPDQQAAEKIKFSPVRWIGSCSTTAVAINAQSASVAKAVDHIIGDDFEFTEEAAAALWSAPTKVTRTLKTHPSSKFLQNAAGCVCRAPPTCAEPYEHTWVRFRVDGELRNCITPVAIKKLACVWWSPRMDALQRIPRDGRMKLRWVRTRSSTCSVSTLPTLFGEKIVIRILELPGAKLVVEPGL